MNAVSPGLVETELHARNGDPGRIDRMSPTVPMQRGGRPEEIAAGVLWLLSPEASYTTGAILEMAAGGEGPENSLLDLPEKKLRAIFRKTDNFQDDLVYPLIFEQPPYAHDVDR